MFSFLRNLVEIFVPGIGYMQVPKDEAPHWGVVDGMNPPYKSVSQIKQAAKKEHKPVFILSKSIPWRKRVGRIIYGKEGEDIFL
jgi:hypothetical protein